MIQEMYYKKYSRVVDPFKDIGFKSSREARDAKRRQLQAIPEKRKVSSAALTIPEHQRIAKSFDENTPDGQRKFYQIAAFELAWRGGEAATCLIEYFKEEIRNDGLPSGRIQYNPTFSKTLQGGAQKLAEKKWLVANTADEDLCPVRLFRTLMSKRTDKIKTPRLFLTVNPNWHKEASSGWFKNMPIGKNEIAKWTKQGAEKIGLDVKRKKITNHSNRASAVTQLAKSGLGEQQLIKLTGHSAASSASSIKPYLQIDSEHHLKIVQQMRSDDGIASSSKISNPPLMKREDGSIVYNNCTFYFNCLEKNSS